MQLDFIVEEQTLRLVSVKKVVADSVDYLTCKITFSDDWEGVTKSATFFPSKGEPFTQTLEDDCCVVPHEVIKAPMFKVSVFGGELITTNKVIVGVVESGYVRGATPKPPTPDVYSQILEKCDEAVETANDAKEKADNIDLDAEKAAEDAEKNAKAYTDEKIKEVQALSSGEKNIVLPTRLNAGTYVLPNDCIGVKSVVVQWDETLTGADFAYVLLGDDSLKEYSDVQDAIASYEVLYENGLTQEIVFEGFENRSDVTKIGMVSDVGEVGIVSITYYTKSKANEYTDEKIEGVQAGITELERNVVAALQTVFDDVSRVNDGLNDFKNETNATFSEIQGSLNYILESLNTGLDNILAIQNNLIGGDAE